MIRQFGTRCCYGFSMFFTYDLDIVEEERRNKEMTPIDRLKSIFEKDNQGNASDALITIANTCFITFVAGGVLGGVNTTKETFISFIENNEATTFRNQHDAKRTLSDKMTLSFYRGFMSLGPKVSIFCTTFMTVSTMLMFYKNKSNVIDYTAGGCCAGALYKWNLGPKGMIAGGIVGAVFGTIYGGLAMLTLYLAKYSFKDFTLSQKNIASKRHELVVQAEKDFLKKQEHKKLDELTLNVGGSKSSF